jgi:hypothetical protein
VQRLIQYLSDSSPLKDERTKSIQHDEKRRRWTMSTGSLQTARIIQFPAGGRKALAERARPLTSAATLEAEAAATVAGDAWYHEAAIQDAKSSGER